MDYIEYLVTNLLDFPAREGFEEHFNKFPIEELAEMHILSKKQAYKNNGIFLESDRLYLISKIYDREFKQSRNMRASFVKAKELSMTMGIIGRRALVHEEPLFKSFNLVVRPLKTQSTSQSQASKNLELEAFLRPHLLSFHRGKPYFYSNLLPFQQFYSFSLEYFKILTEKLD